uniref:G_PROTEIN_RECEP_F1_2 domain-containing protein n=1 Tax=Steinernema glaseri TaxID=37863 RepID=A0A1I7YAE3_9BILA
MLGVVGGRGRRQLAPVPARHLLRLSAFFLLSTPANYLVVYVSLPSGTLPNPLLSFLISVFIPHSVKEDVLGKASVDTAPCQSHVPESNGLLFLKFYLLLFPKNPITTASLDLCDRG